MKAQMELYFFFNFGVRMEVSGQRHGPVVLFPGNKPAPTVKETVWCGRVRKIPPPPRFDALTVQPVPSHYTDYAIPVSRPHKFTTEYYLLNVMPLIPVEIYQPVREICCLCLQGLKWRHQYAATLQMKCAQYDQT